MKKPLLKPGLLVSPVSEGYVVYDIEHNRMHELNPSAALLLELCNGQRPVATIAEIASGVLPDDAESAVLAWIVEAEEAEILVDGDCFDVSSTQKMSADELISTATKLRDEGLVQAAFVCQDHAVRLEPMDARQLRQLGELAHILGRRQAARDAYERYLDLETDDAEVRHLLTSLRDEQAPGRVPSDCIRQLYHRFATFYESNMCDELGYEGPKQLRAAIDDVIADRRDLKILDLGCGTGLAGMEFRARAKRLVGVDLSPEMIEQAKNRAIYDELHVGEVTEWLRNSDEKFDLILACDTFIYFGDLYPVLSLAAEQLESDGAVGFSVERAPSGSHQLTDNGRYVHHRSHLETAGYRAGLKICGERQAFIRLEYGVPVEGIYVCMCRICDSQTPD